MESQSNTLSSLKCQGRLTLSRLMIHVRQNCTTEKKKYFKIVVIHTPIIPANEYLQKPQQNYMPVNCAQYKNSIRHVHASCMHHVGNKISLPNSNTFYNDNFFLLVEYLYVDGN